MRRSALGSLILAIVLVLVFALQRDHSITSAATADWPMYMHDISRTGDGADTTVSAANAAQLTNAWTFPTGGVIAGGAAIVGNVAYRGSWDGYLYAINVTTGQQVWRRFLGTTNVTACNGTSNLGITSTPAVVNGVVYVGGGDSNWYAVDAATGNILWSVGTGDNSASGGHYNWSSPPNITASPTSGLRATATSRWYRAGCCGSISRRISS